MKNQKLIIVAKIVAKDNKLDLVKAEISKLIDVTREEEGCITYDLHQDNENPNFFLVYEIWENEILWKKHAENPNLSAFTKATEGAVAEFTVNQMTLLK